MIISNEKWRQPKEGTVEVLEYYNNLRNKLGKNHDAISAMMKEWFSSMRKDDPKRSHQHYHFSDEKGLYFAADFSGPDDGRRSRPRYDILHPITKKPCKKPSTGWRWEEERTQKALVN